jgi:hypothetical protein
MASFDKVNCIPVAVTPLFPETVPPSEERTHWDDALFVEWNISNIFVR